MKKVMVAIPAYSGTIHCDTMMALMNEWLAAITRSWDFDIVFVPNHSMLPYARNLLAAKFLETDFTHLVFIDSDTSWKGGELCKILEQEADIVGGAVPIRQEPIEYRVKWIEERDELHADPETGFLEVEGLGSAFLVIKREVLETIKEKNPEIEYWRDETGAHKAWEFFKFERIGTKVWGEDMNFCRIAREHGFKVWLAPEIEFNHAGSKKYTGCIGEWLRGRL